jgi:hypothetical protein
VPHTHPQFIFNISLVSNVAVTGSKASKEAIKVKRVIRVGPESSGTTGVFIRRRSDTRACSLYVSKQEAM